MARFVHNVEMGAHGEKRPHVLFLTYYFPPLESAGYSIRAVKFLKYLSGRRWRFTVIAGDPERPITAAMASSSRFLLDEVPEDVAIVRVAAPVYAGVVDYTRHGVSRVLHGTRAAFADRLWMQRAGRVAQRNARDEPVDLILATAPPFMTPVLGTNLKRQLDRPLVLDFRDDWVDTPIFESKPWWQRAVHRRLERHALAAADHVVTASQSSEHHLHHRYAKHAAKIQYLPNGWDPDDMPVPVHRDVPSEQFRVVAAGGYQRADRSPETLLRAVGRLAARRPEARADLRVTLIGTWLYRDFTADELTAWGVTDIVEQIAPMPKHDLMRRLQAAELLLAIPTAYWTRSIPGKLYEYGAIGRAPILLLDKAESTPASFVRERELGSAVPRNDIASIEAELEHYYDAWKAGRPVRIAPGALDAYDRSTLAARLEAVLRQALAS